MNPHLARLRAACCGLSLASPAVGAQATPLNIDFGGLWGSPDASFGAAAGQAGVWNGISFGGTNALTEADGLPDADLSPTHSTVCVGAPPCGSA